MGLDQDRAFIETDRNAFTFSPQTAGRGERFIEAAYSHIRIGNEGGKHSFPEFLFRYGLTDRFELRLGYNLETGPASEVPEGNIANNFGINAEQQIGYGFKYQVTRRRPESRLFPASALLVQGHTPIGSIEGRTQVRAGYAWGWKLANGWNFDQAIRFGTDRDSLDSSLNYLVWAPSAVLKMPFGREKRWFTQLEYFGVMSQGRNREFSNHFIDTGLHYLINPNVEVGTIIAFGLNEQSRGVIVNFGFGVRF